MSTRTGDPLLANGPGERRGAARLSVEQPARLRAAELTLEGTIRDAARGGVFLATQILIEVGERGELMVGDATVPVQVVWLRGNAHASGPGMGLAFDGDDAAVARLLALLGTG